MGQQPAMSVPPQKGQGRSSAYHHMALAEIRNSLLPFAAPSETGSSLSSVSTASVSSSHSSVSNGLSDKDLLRQHMGYAEELSPAVRLMKGRGVDTSGLAEYRLHDSVGLNGYTKLPAQVVVVGAKVMRKPSLEKEALRGSPQSVPDSGAGSSRSASPRPAAENSVLGGPPPPGARNSSDELPPPPPPPRSAHTPPPPPPPHSSYRLKRMGPSAPSQRPSPTSRPMVVDNSPQVQQQLQAMAVLSLGEPPPPYHFVPPPAPPTYGVQPRASPTHQPDYARKSPSSSGVYSASGSLGSPSPVLTPPHVPPHAPPLVRQAKTLPPVIMHSVKSMQVPKPVLQTAIAPTAPPSPPPPPYQASVAAKSVAPNVGVKGVASSVASKNVTPSVPTTEPPSYASTMQALAAAQAPARPMPTDQSALVSTVEISLNKHHLPYHQPPPPPPHHQQRKYTPKEGEAAASSKTNGVDSGGSPRPGKIDHQSPIPERKHVSKEKEDERRDCKVRNYSPQAFKFFMEQHVENVLKSHRQRIFRRMQLENEMSKIGLSEEAQAQMRKMLSQKESNYIRLKRAKMDKSMFVRLKHIGVGAFGEVEEAEIRKEEVVGVLKVETREEKEVVVEKKEERKVARNDQQW